MSNTNESKGAVVAQKVNWGPSDGYEAGIRVFGTDDVESSFVPWADLKRELQLQLLPQLFANPKGYVFETKDYHGKKGWLVQICNTKGAPYCDVWFGKDPDQGWRFDGMIRVGEASERPHVWQAYQRYSDGSYRRLFSATATIDEFVRQREKK